MRRLYLVLLIAGLATSFVVSAHWWQVSAKNSGEISRLYFPYVLGDSCVPGPVILPDDINKDTAVENRINEIRDQNGLPRFNKSQKVTQAALRHSNDMADNKFFDHIGSDGTDAGDRLDEACYDWWSYGEIIAAGYKTPASVVEAWMGSPGHRAIILDGQLTDFGAGYAYTGATVYKHYWTVDFGLQAPSQITAQGDYHTCIHHLKDEDGEIWMRLHTRQPCEPLWENVSQD
jgi:hypothetical protein